MGSSHSIEAVTKFEVQVGNGRSFFHVGDQVRGTVSVQVLETVPISSVFVTLQGKCQVRLELLSESRTIFERQTKVKECTSGVLSPGTYHFDFSFFLGPESLPATFQLKTDKHQGRIEWNLIVQVRQPGWLFSTKKTVVHERSIEIRAAKPGPTVPLVIQRNSFQLDSGFAWFKSKGAVLVHGFVGKRWFAPGEACSVTLFMDNVSNVSFDVTKVQLVERIKLNASGMSKTHSIGPWALRVLNKRETEEPFETYEQALSRSGTLPTREGLFGADGKKTALRFTLMLPLNIDRETEKTDLVEVQHVLVFALQPRSLFTKKRVFEVPITIRFVEQEMQPQIVGAMASIPVAREVSPRDVETVKAAVALG